MDSYLGEIRLFAGQFAPAGWAFCDGTKLPIRQYTALFAILGVQFGGDGVTNFALPDFRTDQRVPIHQGQGTGLTQRNFASTGGSATVTLNLNQIPSHTHLAQTVATQTEFDPTGAYWANSGGRTGANAYNSTADVQMNPAAIAPTGGTQPHNNMQPFLGLNFIISIEGEFPPRG